MDAGFGERLKIATINIVGVRASEAERLAYVVDNSGISHAALMDVWRGIREPKLYEAHRIETGLGLMSGDLAEELSPVQKRSKQVVWERLHERGEGHRFEQAWDELGRAVDYRLGMSSANQKPLDGRDVDAWLSVEGLTNCRKRIEESDEFSGLS